MAVIRRYKRNGVVTRVHAEGSVLDGQYNLICENGHRAYSPEPAVYINAECRSTGNCHARLSLLKGARIVRKRKPKSKLRKMRRF